MDVPTSGGGIDLHRAMEHERAAILFHFLIRLHQNPASRITIETYEDATITCPDGKGGELIEDIQCKKIEAPEDGQASFGMDDWWSAQLTKKRLYRWLEEDRRGDSSIGRLVKTTNRYLTLLVYAEPSKPVQKYLPSGVVQGGFTRSPATIDYFPLDFSSTNDPDPTSSLGSFEARRKIRIVPLGPPLLHAFSNICLHKDYGVMRGKTPDALSATEYLLYHHLARPPDRRTFTLSDIETAIKPFRLGTGKWTDVRDLMAAEKHRAPTKTSSDIPFVLWSDFDEGRFIKTDFMHEGVEAIIQYGLIVIAGNNGGGKTVLCKYLAHAYQTLKPGAKCFYLQVRAGDDLRDELDIFQSQLSKPDLFIIDDAQFSEEAVVTIAQAYVDLRLTKSLAAKLVIATTETSYSSARREGRTHPLDEAHHLKFAFLSAEKMQHYLAAYRAYRPRDGKVADSSIVSMAGGDDEQVNMGVALVLAHAVDPEVVQASQPLSLESEPVRRAVGRWLASTLQLTYSEYSEHVAPVFTICSFGLPVGSQFSHLVEHLATAGFLLQENSVVTTLFRLRPEYSSLAWIISRQTLAAYDQIFLRYAELHKTLAAKLAKSLSSFDTGRRTLFFLLEQHLDLFVPASETRNLDLAALTDVIAVALKVRPNSAWDFVRICFRHGEGAQERMIALRASAETALRIDVRPLANFMNVAYRADQNFAASFGTNLIDNDADLYRLITAVRNSPCNLEDMLVFLAAAKNCDIRFGTKVAADFARTKEYEEKWAEVVSSDNMVLLILVLRALRAVNRRLFIEARDIHLTEELIIRWIDTIQDVGAFVSFLSGIRQLSPRMASRALNLVMTERKSSVASLITRAGNISESTLAIMSISRIDRRIATRLAREHFSLLSSQLAREPSYHNFGSALMRVRRTTTRLLAQDLARYTPVALMAEHMQDEKTHLNLVGRLLDGVAEIAPDVASDIAVRLDYGNLYSKVKRHSLMNFSQLTRGLHVALPLDGRQKLLSFIHHNPDLSTAFHRSLFGERILHQIADALSTMASAELATSEIFRLFGTDETAFLEFVRVRMADRGSRRYSDLEIANCLFALALLNPAYSADALGTYVDGVDISGDSKSKVHLKVPGRSGSKAGMAAKREKRFGDGKVRAQRRVDLAGTGALLQISSAIDEDAAKALLAMRLSSLDRATTDKNLGRHSILLLGMNNVSRGACLQFMNDIYTAERAETLFEAVQNPRELIQFLYAVQLVSIGECQRIGSALIQRDAVLLRDYLEAEADLGELSRWIMTLSSTGDLGLLDAGRVSTECAEYDSRLWALIDSAQAMLSASVSDGAAGLMTKILENINQVRGIRKLSHCIQMWLKADYISRQLRQPRVITQLTEAMLPRALDLIPLENDPLCRAFAVGLWLDSGLISSNQRDQLQVFRALQLKRIQLLEFPTVRSVLIASLLQETEDRIAALVSKLTPDSYPVWIAGLLQACIDSCSVGGLCVPVGTTAVSSDQNNVKYGFACYAKRRSHGSLSQAEANGLTLRNADEGSAAIRHLLSSAFDGGSLRANPYYLWTYLKRTILALSFLDWDHEVHRANRAETFRIPSSPDPGPILHAAE